MTVSSESGPVMSPPVMSLGEPALCGERIAIVLGSLELGGAERQALLLAQYLRDTEKASVEIWGFLSPGRAAELCDQSGIPWKIVPLSWHKGYIRRFLGLRRLTNTLKKSHISMVLPYTILPNVACGLIWRRSTARICIWNQRDEGVQRLEPAQEVRAAGRVSAFVANSNGGARFLKKELGVNPELIRVISNGVVLAEAELDRSTWRGQLELREDCLAVCMVGNLHGNKDHLTLLKAWRIVLDEMAIIGRPAVLVLAGRKDDSRRLEILCREMSIGHAVRVPGVVKDIAGLLQAMDIGVLSSRSEGCPNGLLECMAAGLPVAGTDIPGIRDVIGPGGDAFLAPPGDAEALARCIITLAHDPELRATLGAANRHHVNDKFSPQKMCEQTVALIRQLKADSRS